MYQYSQVKTSHAFQGCAKIVFWLYTARTENPDTPQTNPSASDIHEYHSDTSRHQLDIPQTSPGIMRCQQTPTDPARILSQIAPVSVLGCPGLSV